MNTEQSGAAKIRENTDNLKADFDKLLADVEEMRLKLTAKAGILEELNKTHRLINDWLEEVESNVQLDEAYRNDLNEKRAQLEKYKTVQRDMLSHTETVEKFKLRLAEDLNISKSPFNKTIDKYEDLRKTVAQKIQVSFFINIFIYYRNFSRLPIRGIIKKHR